GTATPTETATDTVTPQPTDTPETTATDTATPEPTATETPLPTETPEPTSTPEPTVTDTAEPTATPQPTATETPTETSTATVEPPTIVAAEIQEEDGGYRLAGTAAPNTSLEVTVDGTLVQTMTVDSSGQWTVTLELPAGAYTVGVQVRDVAGA